MSIDPCAEGYSPEHSEALFEGLYRSVAQATGAVQGIALAAQAPFFSIAAKWPTDCGNGAPADSCKTLKLVAKETIARATSTQSASRILAGPRVH